MRTGTQRFRKTVVSRAIITALCGTASMMVAQETLAQSSSSLQRVEITGSNIKRTDTETASPVQVLTRDDIEKSGKQSIQEVLRQVTADNQGSVPASFSNGFAAGSAAVSLRGMGVNSTLVLVNGRRMTTYGLADDGSRNFVDLNSLPLEAVDRIEVLKDGASAVYGSDAIGGVVNVILRKNYTGRTIGASTGVSQKGDGQTARVFGTVGFGNVDTDRFNVLLSAEYSKTKNIWSTDRGFIGESDLTSLNYYDVGNGVSRPYLGPGTGPTANSPFGVFRNPATGLRENITTVGCTKVMPNGLCYFNPRTQQEIQPAIDRFNVFGRGTLEINANTTGYAEVGYFRSKTMANGTLGASNDGGVFNPQDLSDPLLVHGLFPLPGSHPDNRFGVAGPTAANFGVLPHELGGRDGTTDNKLFRFVGGVKGNAMGWDYDTGVAYIRGKLTQARTGYINADEFTNAINNGTYRFSGLGPTLTDPAVMALISPTLNNQATSSVKLIDFKANREIGQLAGGPLGVAFGGEVRWEESDSPSVPGTETASIVGLGFAEFAAKRRVAAVFGEINAPVTKWLELNAALRHDRYSDFGGTTNPKAGFKLTPLPQLAVRGTYSEAFRAPGPAESGGSSFGFTSVGILTQGNSNIKPETAKSYTLGFILEPMPGTSATLDFWKINRKNEIVQADPAGILAGNPPSTGTPGSRIAGAVPGSFIYYDPQGNIGTVTGFYGNAASTKTDGVDLEMRHRMSLGENGRLTAQVNWTHTRKYQRTDAFGNTVSYEGTHGPIALSSGMGTPRNRGSFSLSWDRGPVTITGMVNYTGPMKMVDSNGEQAHVESPGIVTDAANHIYFPNNGDLSCGVYDLSGNPFNGCKLKSLATFDLYAKWTPMKNLDLNFSIQNVFNTKAPFDPYLVLSYGTNYNQTWHQSGAIGRYFTVGARYSF